MKADADFIGEFEGVFRGVAIGWVVCVRDPNDKVVVEVLCDGYAVAIDRAEIARTDLAEKLKSVTGAKSDTCFGFQIAVPLHAVNAGAAVSIRIANTQVEFAPKIKLSTQKRTQRTAGEVHTNGSLLVTGWVYPREHRTFPVEVTVKEDDDIIATFVADEPVAQQGDNTLPALIRGFKHRLPMRFADGKMHSLRFFDDTGSELKGSPISVIAWKSGIEGLISALEDSFPISSSAGHTLQSLRLAIEKSTQFELTSVPFSEYLEWSKLYGAKPTGQAGTKVFQIVMYGEGDQTVTLKSLACQEGWIKHVVSEQMLLDHKALDFNYPLVFVRSGDRLDPHALDHAALALVRNRVIYSDSDQEIDGTVIPWFKPDWDRFLYLSQGYVVGMLAGYLDAKSAPSILKECATVEDVMVRMVDVAGDDIGHIDLVLYHQMRVNAHGEAPIKHAAFRSALNKSDMVKAIKRRVTPSIYDDSINSFECFGRDFSPKVCIIIPSKNKVELLKTAIETLREKTLYPNYKIIVIDNNSSDPESLKYLRKLVAEGYFVLKYSGAFNFSAINNFAVSHCNGDLICLLNNDVEIFSKTWLSEMVNVLLIEGVGAVGAKLLWKNEMVQHGGVVLGIDRGAIHTGNRWSRNDPGYAGLNHALRQNSCVTAACLLIRKADYLSIGGMNEVDFPVTFNDVDLCLRLRQSGKEIVWVPSAELFHLESASRGKDELAEKMARAHRELSNLRAMWGTELMSDPFYNRNLNQDRAPFEGLALPPKVGLGT